MNAKSTGIEIQGRMRMAVMMAGLSVLATLAGCAKRDGESSQSTPSTLASSTSAPASTGVVESSIVASTAVSAVTSDTTGAPAHVGVLSDWPTAPEEFMALEDAPYVLPTVDIEARSIELSTIDLSATDHDVTTFVQEYVLAGGEMFAWIETSVGRSPSVSSDAAPLTVDTWTSAQMVENATGSSIVLSDVSGGATVSVVGTGGTSDVALLIASSLVPRPAGEAGWVLQSVEDAPAADRAITGGATLVSEGWNFGSKQRTTRWLGPDAGPVVEVLVAVGRPQLAWTQLASIPSLVDGFTGGKAISQVIPGKGSLVAWSPMRDVTITVVTRGAVADTLRVAQSVSVVSEQDWVDSGVLLPPRVEVGCDYFFSDC